MNEPNVLTTILSAWEANNSESHKVEGDKHPLVFVGGGFLFTWVKKGQNSSFQKICWHYFWWGFKTQLVFSGASDTFNVSPRSPGSFLQNYCLRHWGNLTNSFRKEVQQKTHSWVKMSWRRTNHHQSLQLVWGYCAWPGSDVYGPYLGNFSTQK